MKKHMIVAAIAASLVGVSATPVLADRHNTVQWAQRGDHDRHDRRKYDNRREWRPEHHYRQDDRKYKERRLGKNDVVYRGNDGRYYCKRKDGTTGLIVGAIGGGVLGNVIAPGGNKTLGTILGGGAGALIGKSLDDGVKCR